MTEISSLFIKTDNFEIKDLGEQKHFLGIEYERKINVKYFHAKSSIF